MKPKYAKRCNLACAVRRRRVHRIHDGETGTNGHDHGYQIPKDLNGKRGRCLRREIIPFRKSIELHSPVIRNAILYRLDGRRILDPNQQRTVNRPFVFLGNLVVIALDFRIVGAFRGIENADNVPSGLANLERVPDLCVFEPQ